MTWDIARGPTDCQRCSAVIGAGEPIRLVTQVRLRYCETCAVRVFGDPVPADLPIVRVLETLKIPQAIGGKTGFSRFDPPDVVKGGPF